MAGKSFLKLGQTGIGTQTAAERTAGVGTAVGTLTFDTDGSNLQVYKSDAEGWTNVTSGSISASGGTEFVASNGKNGYAFTSNANFVVSSGSANIEYIIIAGGGGGGVADGGGGGGGGGVMTNIAGLIPGPATGDAMPISPGTYPVVRGNGGGKGTPPNNPGDPGDDGGSSSFNSITAGGGGGGGAAHPPHTVGRGGQPPGGNGGGAGAYQNNVKAGGSGNGHGNDGASSAWMNWGGGGGAGAGANGSNGNGGNGIPIPTQYIPSDYGTPGPAPGRWFAGGGGGGHGDPSAPENTPAVTGGAGGGGRGEVANPPNTMYSTATDGTANTGGGGGGKDLHDNSTPTAGDGGSGIVFIFHD